MTKTMTKKDFYTAVANNTITDEVIAKAKELLAKTEEDASKSAKKRKEAQTESRKVNIDLARKFAERIGDRTLAASEIYVLCGDIEGVSSTSKVTAICKVGVDEGIFTSIDDYKVGGKGSKVKGYTPVQ